MVDVCDGGTVMVVLITLGLAKLLLVFMAVLGDLAGVVQGFDEVFAWLTGADFATSLFVDICGAGIIGEACDVWGVVGDTGTTIVVVATAVTWGDDVDGVDAGLDGFAVPFTTSDILFSNTSFDDVLLYNRTNFLLN